MNIFRRLPTAKLLLLCASVVAFALAVVAVAGAVGSDPKPPPQAQLADALHTAATAPPVDGVTADIQFTNHLVGLNGLHGVSPYIAGASGRLWWSKDGHFRIELRGQNANDSNLVVNGKDFWAYDGGSNTVYRGTLPADKKGAASEPRAKHAVPTVADIQKKLDEIMKHATIAGPDPGVEANTPTYSVRVSPKDNGGLLGGVGLAWDAARGIPIRVGVYARGNSTPVLELKATDIQFSVDQSAFAIQPPPGSKVVDVAGKKGADKGASGSKAKQPKPTLADVPFTVVAPTSLAGKQRTELKAVRMGDQVGAVAVYGEGLDSIVVVERPASKDAGQATPPATGGDHHGQIDLPTTDVNGNQARVLETPLGGGLEWTQGNVSFVVAGSQPRSVLEAAARDVK
jgi:outer membrane lipoprotein-sorting protein